MTEQCPRCGAPLVEREGRFGRFYGCARWPACAFSASPRDVAEAECPTKRGLDDAYDDEWAAGRET